MHFLGRFDYAIDERGRVPIPPRYRDALRPGVVLSQGSPNPCVRVYTLEAFEQLAQKYMGPSALHQKGRDLRLNLFSRAHEAQLDQQSRVLIPGALREYAGLSGKVLLVGAGEWMELWAPEAYEAEMSRIDAALPAMLESVEERP